jgi:hypothetical protein
VEDAVTTKVARMSYEVLVERHLSPAMVATFPVALTTTTVPRNRVHRLRVRADQDLADVVRRLTERRVQLLEIRRCPAPGAPRPPAGPRPDEDADPHRGALLALPTAAAVPADREPAGRRVLATVSRLAPRKARQQ